jgi:hypothetical protein
VPGIALAWAWSAGTGPVAVVAHAREAAGRRAARGTRAGERPAR